MSRTAELERSLPDVEDVMEWLERQDACSGAMRTLRICVRRWGMGAVLAHVPLSDIRWLVDGLGVPCVREMRRRREAAEVARGKKEAARRVERRQEHAATEAAYGEAVRNIAAANSMALGAARNAREAGHDAAYHAYTARRAEIRQEHEADFLAAGLDMPRWDAVDYDPTRCLGVPAWEGYWQRVESAYTDYEDAVSRSTAAFNSLAQQCEADSVLALGIAQQTLDAREADIRRRHAVSWAERYEEWEDMQDRLSREEELLLRSHSMLLDLCEEFRKWERSNDPR